MTTHTIVNLFRNINLISHICKSDGTSSCLHYGHLAAFLGFLGIYTSKFSFALVEYCYQFPLILQGARPQG